MTENRELLIAGSGIAGISAAIAARQNYPDINISILSSDPFGFYNRIALNSFVTDKKKAAISILINHPGLQITVLNL